MYYPTRTLTPIPQSFTRSQSLYRLRRLGSRLWEVRLWYDIIWNPDSDFSDLHLVADHLPASKDHIPLLPGLSSVTSRKCCDSTLKCTMKTFFLNVINCIFFVMFSAALATANFATKECNVKQNEMKMRCTLGQTHHGYCPHNSESVKSTKQRTTG